LTCASNMQPLSRKVQAEQLSTLPAYHVRSNPLLASTLFILRRDC
jgi:hypothetical protein